MITNSEAYETLMHNIAEDDSYYYSWQSNIAMSIYDEFINAGYRFPEMHKLCNQGAIRFLDMAIQLAKKEPHDADRKP